MNRLIIIVILSVLAWQGYTKYQSYPPANASAHGTSESAHQQPFAIHSRETVASSPFKCDGRTYCSQMASCAEATFFLRNCPGVKMDGDNDGVPCEQQWCK